MPAEKLGSVRQLLQDLLAPQIARLDEKVITLTSRSGDLAKEVEKSREEIRDLWKEWSDLRDRMSRVEGRFEGVKEEIAAKVQLFLTRNEGTPSSLPSISRRTSKDD